MNPITLKSQGGWSFGVLSVENKMWTGELISGLLINWIQIFYFMLVTLGECSIEESGISVKLLSGTDISLKTAQLSHYYMCNPAVIEIAVEQECCHDSQQCIRRGFVSCMFFSSATFPLGALPLLALSTCSSSSINLITSGKSSSHICARKWSRLVFWSADLVSLSCSKETITKVNDYCWLYKEMTESFINLFWLVPVMVRAGQYGPKVGSQYI